MNELHWSLHSDYNIPVHTKIYVYMHTFHTCTCIHFTHKNIHVHNVHAYISHTKLYMYVHTFHTQYMYSFIYFCFMILL